MIQRSSLTSLWPQQDGIPVRTARTRRQQALLAIALILGITIVFCLYLMQTSKITVTDYDMRDMRVELSRLQRQNSNLLATYAYEQNVVQMNKRAEQAGFQPVEAVRYITLEEKLTQTAAADVGAEADDSSMISMR